MKAEKTYSIFIFIVAAVLTILSIEVNGVNAQPGVPLESLNDVNEKGVKITLETYGGPVNPSPGYGLEIYGDGNVYLVR